MRALVLISLFSIFIVGCVKSNTVIVDIEEPNLRSKYLEVLNTTDLQYSEKETGEIIVEVDDIETLKKLMGKYYEYRAMRVRKLNEQLKK